MKKTNFRKVMGILSNGRYFRLHLFIQGILVGIFTGFLIVIFRFSIEKLENFRISYYKELLSSAYVWGFLCIIVYVLIAFFLVMILKKEPMSSGSGIPQIKGILCGQMHMNWASVLFWKLIGGIIAIGAGLSLGREGPSVQIGAAVGQGISHILGRSRFEEQFLLTSGAGAGLAAAFNAPLAGVVFCLEELQKNFSPFVLMATVSATLASTIVAQYFFGYGPIFHLPELPVLPVSAYGLLIILGVFHGILGRGFNIFMNKSLDLYEHFLPQQSWKRFLLPLSLAGILGLFLPEVLGGGNQLVDSLGNMNYGIVFLCILFLGKFLFTMLSFGSGAPGGIFLPMLVLGALLGSIFGYIVSSLGFLSTIYVEDLIVFSMAGYFAAVVKSPVTGSILIMEMTGSFAHMLPLILVSMVAYVIADFLKGKPVYDELLERSLIKQQKWKQAVKSRRIVYEIVIEPGAPMAGKLLKDVIWPKHTLVVNLKRGEVEVIPTGNTLLKSGDYLYIFGDDKQINQLMQLAGTSIEKNNEK